MNLTDVIELLVDERSLAKDEIVSVVCEGIKAAYLKKFPYFDVVVTYNRKTDGLEIGAEKQVVSTPDDKDVEISLRAARAINAKAEIGDVVIEPIKEPIGRIEILVAKQVIAGKIRELEQTAVYKEFKEKEGSIISGMLHKRESAGFVVKLGDNMAFLPKSCVIPEEVLRIGYPIRALLKEVLPASRGDHQLILDRITPEFVAKLLELEIPEVFEGVVEIKKVVRAAGYKSKIVVSSNSSEVDPVGTCVGVGGVRIKPILKELGSEKIDLIEQTEDIEKLVAQALKPAEIDKVVVNEEAQLATVWLAKDQRSFAIGRSGKNISLASDLTGLNVQLQDDTDVADAADALGDALSQSQNNSSDDDRLPEETENQSQEESTEE